MPRLDAQARLAPAACRPETLEGGWQAITAQALESAYTRFRACVHYRGDGTRHTDLPEQAQRCSPRLGTWHAGPYVTPWAPASLPAVLGVCAELPVPWVEVSRRSYYLIVSFKADAWGDISDTRYELRRRVLNIGYKRPQMQSKYGLVV